jgi:photosystem II stability/assembly factor-like uncharacterized protein
MKKISTTLFLILINFSFPFQIQAQTPKDAPATWTDYSATRDMLEVSCMYYLDPKNAWIASPDAILHSTDGGKTWEQQYTGRVRIISLYFKNSQDGYAVGYQSLFLETHDGGANWNIHPKKNKDDVLWEQFQFIKIYFTDDKTGYLLSTNNVLKTTDGGLTWKKTGPDRPASVSSPDFRSMAFTDSKHGILVGDEEMLFTTNDGGTTWTANKKDFFTGNRRRFWCVAFANSTTGWITCAGEEGDTITDCLYTTDGGATWAPKEMFKGYSVRSLIFNGNCGTAIYSGNPHTVLVTTDGGATWTEQTVLNSLSRHEKVFAAQVFSPGVGFAGLMDNTLHFHVYVPKQ